MKVNFLILFLLPLILFIPAAVFAEDVNSPYLDSVNDIEKAISFDELFAVADNESKVRLIVALKMPESDLGVASSENYLEEKKKLVDQVQQDFLGMADLPLDGELEIIHNFEYSPYILMELDSQGLENISGSPLIEAVMQDVPEPALLTNSNPVIGSPSSWLNGFSGKGQTVAILDTGIDASHRMLEGKIVSEACYSSSNPASTAKSACPGGTTQELGPGAAEPCDVLGCSHGTHVAGIVAGKTVFSGPQKSYSGVAKDANIIAIQVFTEYTNHPFCSGACPLTHPSDQIKGLERVLNLRNDFDISSVNLSLGAGRHISSCDSTDLRKEIVEDLKNVGIAVIAASGNDRFSDGIAAPACLQNVVSVGSTNTSDIVSTFSNSAPILDLLAPGDSIRSAVPGNSLSFKGGTSMASPHVAGAWAVLKEKIPSASNSEILSSLKDTGVMVTDPRNNVVVPRIQIDEAVCDLSNVGTGCLETKILEGISIDGTIKVEISTGFPEPNNTTNLNIKIKDANNDNLKNNVNYNIKAFHEEVEVLSEISVYKEIGYAEHTTDIFTNQISDSTPLEIEVEILGFGPEGDDTNWTGPKGDVLMYTVVPEFAGIGMMILIVSLLFTVILIKKSTLLVKI